MTVYKWKLGSRVKADPQTAGAVCADIEDRVGLTPKALVDASRDVNAPLHGCFEWNDEIAAERYRETQAGYIIRSLEIVTDSTVEPVKAFVSTLAVDDGFEYVSTETALSIPTMRNEVLDSALRELRSFERKYRGLSELAEVMSAIRKVA